MVEQKISETCTVPPNFDDNEPVEDLKFYTGPLIPDMWKQSVGSRAEGGRNFGGP